MSAINRYANDWNSYSQWWDQEFGQKYRNLGDEWNDDATGQRKRDDFYFSIFAERFLRPDMTVLEVGPGGGKWTVRLAPRVRKVICLDVAEEMLKRTEKRCQDEGLSNVELVLSNGRDFQPIADASVDFFFSYDVFVHIALEDTYPYTQEMNRVLKGGGRGTCHYAVNSVPQAWNRVEHMNDWYRGGAHTIGQYFYYSPDALRRMYEHCGLIVVEQHIEDWHCTCMFAKPAGSPVPNLERLLWKLLSPDAADAGVRAETIAALRRLPAELESALAPSLNAAESAEDFGRRAAIAADIRRIWRGIMTKAGGS